MPPKIDQPAEIPVGSLSSALAAVVHDDETHPPASLDAATALVVKVESKPRTAEQREKERQRSIKRRQSQTSTQREAERLRSQRRRMTMTNDERKRQSTLRADRRRKARQKLIAEHGDGAVNPRGAAAAGRKKAPANRLALPAAEASASGGVGSPKPTRAKSDKGEKRRSAVTPEQREAERQRSLMRRQKMTPEDRKRESAQRAERRHKARERKEAAAAGAAEESKEESR